MMRNSSQKLKNYFSTNGRTDIFAFWPCSRRAFTVIVPRLPYRLVIIVLTISSLLELTHTTWYTEHPRMVQIPTSVYRTIPIHPSPVLASGMVPLLIWPRKNHRGFLHVRPRQTSFLSRIADVPHSKRLTLSCKSLLFFGAFTVPFL